MAKRKGLDVTCEVTPHHFTLTDEDLAGANYNPNWKMNPPLRPKADVEAVLNAIYDGTVDAIVTDHAPHHQDEKDLDFSEAPFGIVGLETAVSLALDRLVAQRVIGLSQLVRLMSTRPAELYHLPGGTLQAGSPADLTLLDLRTRVTVDPSTFRSLSRNTPFAGMSLRGRPAAAIVAGRVVWEAEN
jgi:dihydroorotase